MGTTLTALQAGSMAYQWIVAVEGYKYLLTNGDTAAAIAAWTGTDFVSALGGLFVELDNQQRLDPWNPFQGGGQCMLTVSRDAADTIGIDTHRTQAGSETVLRSTATRATTAIDVKRSDDFAAPTTDAFIGTECFEYSAKPNTNTMTASKRGKYSPFAAGGTGSPRFANHHRVGIAGNGVQLEPVVSQQPRSWIGRRVGVWMHRLSNGVLDVKAQAQCVYSGTIVEIRDDPNTGNTAIQLRHVLDTIKEFTIGRDIFAGTCANGYYLATGLIFKFYDTNDNGNVANKTATSLTVVASGAATSNQINAGYYTLSEFCSAINSWLAGETAAARIYGSYTLFSPENTTQGNRSVMHFYVPNGGGNKVALWQLTLPNVAVANWLGNQFAFWSGIGLANTAGLRYETSGPPADALIFTQDPNGFTFSAKLTSKTGTFIDNYSMFPAALKNGLPANGGGLPWGCFLFAESILIVGTINGNEIQQVLLAPTNVITGGLGLAGPLESFKLPAGQAATIRQIIIKECNFATGFKEFMYSTGTAGYNDATYDTLPYGLGLGIPADELANFGPSVDALAQANASMLVVIDRPVKFSEQFAAALVLRRCQLIWKNGGLQMTSWSTPAAATAVVLLNETTKAMPANNRGSTSTPTVWDSTWLHNLVKVNWGRDITSLVSGGGGASSSFSGSLSIEDGTSIDDQSGQAATLTINDLNSYDQNAQTGQGIQALLPDFVAWMPLFSRPVRKITRPIDHRYFEGYAPGDVVSVTDPGPRDPVTGKRGIVARPGLITRHRANLGGQMPNDPTTSRDMAGEVDVIFLDVNRIYAYAPCAQIDDTAGGSFSAGYNAAGPTLRCYAHKHSESFESADALNFAGGDKITIVEIDPATPGSPTTWNRTILSVSGNDITLTATLSSPAWDATKKYRIISDAFDVAVAAQQSKCYQAGSDGTIKQLAPANQYAMGSNVILVTPATLLDHTTLPEHHATLAYGPDLGKPRDTGHEKGLALLLENLMDHKTARQSPSLDIAVSSNTTYSAGNGWQLVHMTPIFLGRMLQGGDLIRYLYVAPFFRSSDGTATQIRVSLSGYPLVDATRNDCIIKAPASSATWSTSSTVWAIGAEAALGLQNLNGFEIGWLIIECKIKCETRGLAKCIERERVNV